MNVDSTSVKLTVNGMSSISTRTYDGTVKITPITTYPCHYVTRTEYINHELPKKYIINEKVCVLVWKDGSYTKLVKCPEDKYDPVKAFLWAWFRHTCGLPKWKANKYLGEIAENCSTQKMSKKKKKEAVIIEEIND